MSETVSDGVSVTKKYLDPTFFHLYGFCMIIISFLYGTYIHLGLLLSIRIKMQPIGKDTVAGKVGEIPLRRLKVVT